MSAPRRRYWIIRSGPAFRTMVRTCANLKAGLPREYRLVVPALIWYSKEAPEVISRRWKHAAEMLKAKRMQEADELLR